MALLQLLVEDVLDLAHARIMRQRRMALLHLLERLFSSLRSEEEHELAPALGAIRIELDRALEEQLREVRPVPAGEHASDEPQRRGVIGPRFDEIREHADGHLLRVAAQSECR